MLTTLTEPLEPSFSLAERLAGLTSVSACYQCKKCSAGCPLTFAMDFYPDQVIRLALLGQDGAGSGLPHHLGVLLVRDLHHPLPQQHRHRRGDGLAEGGRDLERPGFAPARGDPLPPDLSGHGADVRRAPVGAAALGPLSMAARRDPGKTQVRRPGCRPADGLGAGPAPPAGPAPAPPAEGRDKEIKDIFKKIAPPFEKSARIKLSKTQEKP